MLFIMSEWHYRNRSIFSHSQIGIFNASVCRQGSTALEVTREPNEGWHVEFKKKKKLTSLIVGNELSSSGVA